jgi:hypothetical protein
MTALQEFTGRKVKKARFVSNAIKISKKRTPGTSEKMVPGGIFLHCFVWDIAQTAAVFL